MRFIALHSLHFVAFRCIGGGCGATMQRMFSRSGTYRSGGCEFCNLSCCAIGRAPSPSTMWPSWASARPQRTASNDLHSHLHSHLLVPGFIVKKSATMLALKGLLPRGVRQEIAGRDVGVQESKSSVARSHGGFSRPTSSRQPRTVCHVLARPMATPAASKPAMPVQTMVELRSEVFLRATARSRAAPQGGAAGRGGQPP